MCKDTSIKITAYYRYKKFLTASSSSFSSVKIPVITGFVVSAVGLDFIQSVEPIIIPAGVQKKCVFIPIINDTEIEGSENFTVIIDTIEQVNGSTVVTIKNTNGMCLKSM